MQDWPLTIDRIIAHAARWHGQIDVVSSLPDGQRARATWATIYDEALRLSSALDAHGIAAGDRIGTLAMNGGRHLAAWFGIMGMGAVCHTLNPRLSHDQLAYVINHAADRLIIADSAFAADLVAIRDRCPTVERVVLIDGVDEDGWDAFLAGARAPVAWGAFPETAAAGLCYTSGTTGRPKGVCYTHRSNYLHTLMIMQPDVFAISAQTSLLLAVPMFHANAWGLCFAAAAAGSKLVLPGPKLDGASLYELIESEGVTLTAGVPTVWQTFLQYLADNHLTLSSLKKVMIGGAPCPEILIHQFADHGVEVQHNWGMTETSPLGTAGMPTMRVAHAPPAEQLRYKLTQGRVPLGVDMAIRGESGDLLPHDGVQVGRLGVRGHSVVERYYGHAETSLDANGYFDTGDIGSIDAEGYLRLTDRAKDAIKSGGEWIGSSEIEDVALSHPMVARAAAVAMPHPKWGERPLLVVEPKPGARIDADDLRAVLVAGLAKWAVPDEIHFCDTIPINGTGKLDKVALRKRYVEDLGPAHETGFEQVLS